MMVERLARIIVIVLAIGVPLAAVIVRSPESNMIEMHGQIAESGGWTPANLTAQAGEVLRLRLTSDDVMHGFAVGQSDAPAVDVKPGVMTDVSLTFNQPGKYVFYCTRWCGPNHWRMRGTIEVTGSGVASVAEPPLYVALGIDIDAQHPAEVVPEQPPSAARGSKLDVTIPVEYLALDTYRTHSPVEVWKELRGDSFAQGLSDQAVWDVVAFIWQSHTTPEGLTEAKRLYAANCAACHGESGQGDGVMADQLPGHTLDGHDAPQPIDFTDPALLGASPALLHGKIVRGGMGTSMPYWGPIFTDDQVWTIVSYLYSFQFGD